MIKRNTETFTLTPKHRENAKQVSGVLDLIIALFGIPPDVPPSEAIQQVRADFENGVVLLRMTSDTTYSICAYGRERTRRFAELIACAMKHHGQTFGK